MKSYGVIPAPLVTEVSHPAFSVYLLASRDGFPCDLVALCEHGIVLSCEDALRCQVVQASVVPPGVVGGHEVLDLPLKFPWEVVVFEEDAVRERAMPALNLALRVRMRGRAVGV